MIYLLDTDTFNHFHGGHPRVKEHVAAVDPANLALTILTRVEVLTGRFEFLRKASTADQLLRAQQRLVESEKALYEWSLVSFDRSAATHFYRLKGQKGLRKIGRVDLLIACITLSKEATLVTRNLRHFMLVPGLITANWVDD